MCGWHKKYLPAVLFELSWVYYSESSAKVGRDNADLKRGICNPEVHRLDHVVETKRQNGLKVSQRMMEQSLGIFDPQFEEKIHVARVESGKDAFVNKTGIHNPNNKQLVLDAGRVAVEQNLGIFDPKNKDKVLNGSRKAGRISISQKWKSTIDGYVSTAPAVANHNIRNGWDPKARIRIL